MRHVMSVMCHDMIQIRCQYDSDDVPCVTNDNCVIYDTNECRVKTQVIYYILLCL